MLGWNCTCHQASWTHMKIPVRIMRVSIFLDILLYARISLFVWCEQRQRSSALHSPRKLLVDIRASVLVGRPKNLFLAGRQERSTEQQTTAFFPLLGQSCYSSHAGVGFLFLPCCPTHRTQLNSQPASDSWTHTTQLTQLNQHKAAEKRINLKGSLEWTLDWTLFIWVCWHGSSRN